MLALFFSAYLREYSKILALFFASCLHPCSFFPSVAIAEELGTELPKPKFALGRVTGCWRTCAVSLSEMDTDYGGYGSDSVGGGAGNGDGGGGSGAGEG